MWNMPPIPCVNLAARFILKQRTRNPYQPAGPGNAHGAFGYLDRLTFGLRACYVAKAGASTQSCEHRFGQPTLELGILLLLLLLQLLQALCVGSRHAAEFHFPM